MISPTTPRLTAIPFDAEITKLTERFTGREWVFEEIDNWLKHQDERFFILTGKPGVGKSAIAARLTQTHQNIAAYHFCIAGESGTIQPNGVLLSLAAQLVEYFPDYAETLANIVKPLRLSVKAEINAQTIKDSVVRGVVIENLYTQSPQETLDIVLRRSLANLPDPPEEPVLILIDSLDEAVTYGDKENLVTLLPGVGDLPTWVRLIVTTRPDEQRVLSYLKTLKPYFYHLDELSQKSLKDVHIYVDERVAGKAIRVRLANSQTEAQSLVEQITDLSKGNFLYTKVLLVDIESGGQPLDNLDTLPKSLDEFYHKFLMRLRSEWETKYQSIFGILTVTKTTVTNKELINFIANNPAIERAPSETQLNQALGVVKQFLDVVPDNDGQSTYRLFHQSLQDFLLDQERDPVFWCSPKDGHRWIVEYCWQYHPNDWQECDRYGLRYLTAHLIDLANLTDQPTQARKHIESLHELLATETFDKCNTWFDAKEKIGDTRGFIADVELARQYADDKFIHNLAKSVSLQYRYALIINSVNSISQNIPVELLLELIKNEIWTVEQGIAYANQIPDSERKASALLEISKYLEYDLILTSLDSTELLPAKGKNLMFVAKIGNFYHVRIFDRTGHKIIDKGKDEFLPNKMLIEQLESAIGSLSIDGQRKDALLRNIASNLGYILDKEKAVELAFNHAQAGYGKALTQLVPYLPEHLLPYAWEASLRVSDEYWQAEILPLIGARMPERLGTILERLQRIKNTYHKARSIAALGPSLTPSLSKEIFRIIRESQDSQHCVVALDGIIPYLPETLLTEALETTKTLDRDSCVKALNILIPRLPRTKLPEVLQILKKYEYGTDIRSRADALITLASYLPDAIDDALSATLTLIGFGAEAPHLSALLSVSPSVLSKVVEPVRKIHENRWKAEALGVLAIYSHELLPETLQAIQSIKEEESRAEVLQILAPKIAFFKPQMQKEVLAGFLQIVSNIQDESIRFKALTNLISYIPETVVSKAIDIAKGIKCLYWRAQVLGNLASHIPKALLTPAVTETVKEIQSASSSVISEYNKAYSFMQLISHWSEYEDAALNAIQLVDSPYGRYQLLASLAPFLARKNICSIKEKSSSSLKSALKIAQLIQDKFEQATALTALAAYSNKLLDKALKTARAISDPFDRAKALIALGSHIPEVFPEALQAINSIKYEGNCAKALLQLAPDLPYNLWNTAWNIVQNKSISVNEVCELVPHLPDTLIPELLKLLKQKRDEISWDKFTDLFIELAPRLPKECLEDAIEVASSSVSALTILASYCFPEQKEWVVFAIKSEQDLIDHARALVDLVPFQPEVVSEALKAVQAIPDAYDSACSGLLSELIPNLPQPLLSEALSTALALPGDYARTEALVALAPYFPEVLPEAIEKVLKDYYSGGYVFRLKDLAPHLSFEYRSEVLRLVMDKPVIKMQDKESKAEALMILAPFIPQAGSEAFSTALTIQDKYSRARILVDLATQMSDALPEAFKAAVNTQKYDYVAALIPYLPEALPAALKTALEIEFVNNYDYRADALSQLVPYLTQLPINKLIPMWQNVVQQGVFRDRKEFLKDIAALSPILLTIGNQDAVVEVSIAIEQVCQWWP